MRKRIHHLIQTVMRWIERLIKNGYSHYYVDSQGNLRSYFKTRANINGLTLDTEINTLRQELIIQEIKPVFEIDW